MELDSENMDEEQERLCRELASVQASLQRLRAQNGDLSAEIKEKKLVLDTSQLAFLTTDPGLIQ